MSEPIKAKRCTKCKEIKAFSEFRKNKISKDGYAYYCKSCMDIYAQKYKDTENYRHSKAKYRKSPKNKIAQNRYNKSKKGRKTRLVNVIKYQKRNPEKLRAQHAVNHQIERGNIVKANFQSCFVCNQKASQYHHYNGYKKANWFKIIPVCTKCHRYIHKNLIYSHSILFRPARTQLPNH